jgi:DNA adenine methylase
MKIKAIAPWFGGKRKLAPRIVEQLGAHSQYFEPFCGSAAVLFAKEPCRQETVNDVHEELINLAGVLQSDSLASRLYLRCERTLFSDAALEEAENKLTVIQPSDRLERAYYYFIACWMARNGVAGTMATNYQLAVRWTKNGGSPTVRWRNAVESIPAWHERLRNVVILCRDGFKILPKFEDSTETAIYVDPPYPHETRTTASRSAGGHDGRYKHDFDSGGEDLLSGQDDHARLAEILNAFKHARIVVSTYDCKRMRELYEGWTVIDCAGHKQLAAQNARGARSKTEAPEILLVNGPRNGERNERERMK